MRGGNNPPCMSGLGEAGLVARGEGATDAEIDAARRAFAGAVGWMVRCTPRRWVLRAGAGTAGRDGEPAGLFLKLREGRWGDARREWAWLCGEGPQLSLPAPVALFRSGGRSLVALREVDGRPLQALLAEASAERVRSYVTERIAPLVAGLHAAGWAYRDLYWNHLFARDLEDDPVWIDVERAFRPRIRVRRWVEKDLAGLVSSAHLEWTDADVDALLEAYARAGGLRVARHRVAARAARVRRRRPRYG